MMEITSSVRNLNTSFGIWSGPGALPTVKKLIPLQRRVGGIGGVEFLAEVYGKENVGNLSLSGWDGSVHGYESLVSIVQCLVTSDMTSAG